MSETSQAVAAEVKRRWIELPEALLIVGSSALLTGFWMIYHALAFIVGGSICIGLGLRILGLFTPRKPKVN